ncbi:MAG: ATP-binding protein [Chloroflexota bacterium]
MQNINRILQNDPLVKLVQRENFLGWVYGIDYDTALVMSNDLWKENSLGVPHNCFLVAASFNPADFTAVPLNDREVILLRVVGSAKLPQDDDLIRTKIDHFQEQTGPYADSTDGPGYRDYDDITLNQIQFGGLECRVLGTFYEKNGELWLGSDLESFASAAHLKVYRPRGAALRIIVNHVDPLRRQDAADEARQLGLKKSIPPFQIGTVRYTSTDRLHRRDDAEKVPVSVQPSDFLARRTAVLGMTRTGKSNMIKQMVAVVKRVADEGEAKIGQIIYDVNGEYANANQQDKGAIADIYPGETVRYRMLKTEGFEELQNNFYIQINEGFSLVRQTTRENKSESQSDVQVFINTSFDEPDPQEIGAHKRWQVRVAAYQAMLKRAGYDAPDGHAVRFSANQDVRQAVDNAASVGMSVPKRFKDPKSGLTLDEAIEWFMAARSANRTSTLRSSSGKAWLDDDTVAILNMMANKNANDAYINGYKVLADARKYHSPRRQQEVGDEVYRHLLNGKIVILDLSVGDPTLRERISQQIAQDIFNKSMAVFLEGKTPPNVVVYIEEAHNLIGKNMDLTETWPRLAKEGAKYRIALVYATQEVSSVHPNILANTENWFITHLNNEREIRELARFYDFADFSRSLIRAQDVGFARVKTLSGPFVVPIQIDKFDPESERQRALAHAARQD